MEFLIFVLIILAMYFSFSIFHRLIPHLTPRELVLMSVFFPIGWTLFILIFAAVQVEEFISHRIARLGKFWTLG